MDSHIFKTKIPLLLPPLYLIALSFQHSSAKLNLGACVCVCVRIPSSQKLGTSVGLCLLQLYT